MVRKAEYYAWSSAASYCGLRGDPLLSPLPEMVPVVIDGWSSLLADKEDEKMLATIRLRTLTGRPAGSEKFVAAPGSAASTQIRGSARETFIGRHLQAAFPVV